MITISLYPYCFSSQGDKDIILPSVTVEFLVWTCLIWCDVTVDNVFSLSAGIKRAFLAGIPSSESIKKMLQNCDNSWECVHILKLELTCNFFLIKVVKPNCLKTWHSNALLPTTLINTNPIIHLTHSQLPNLPTPRAQTLEVILHNSYYPAH